MARKPTPTDIERIGGQKAWDDAQLIDQRLRERIEAADLQFVKFLDRNMIGGAFYKRTLVVRTEKTLSMSEVAQRIEIATGDTLDVYGVTRHEVKGLTDFHQFKVYLDVKVSVWTRNYDLMKPVVIPQKQVSNEDFEALFEPLPTPSARDEDLDILFASPVKPILETDLDPELATIHIEHMTDEAIAALFEAPTITDDIVFPPAPTYEELVREAEQVEKSKQQSDPLEGEPNVTSEPLPPSDDAWLDPLLNAFGLEVVQREDTITTYRNVSPQEFLADPHKFISTSRNGQQ
jgi:hypothetical protein